MKRIKLLRESKGLTLDALSKLTHVHKSTLSRIENGLQEAKQSHIEILSEFFEVSTDYLLDKTNIKSKPPITIAAHMEVKSLNLGQKIIDLRQENNLSRKDLAIELGVSYSSLSKYETNERQPDYEILKKLSTYFGVTIDFLLDNNTDNKTDINNDKPFLIAAHATKDLTEEEQKRLIEFAEFLKATRK